MRKQSRLSISLLFLAFATPAFGQSECSELLRHGIYDYFRDMNVSNSAAYMRSEVCSTYTQAKEKRAAGDASASYGLFSGEVNMSWSELEDLAAGLCSMNVSDQSANKMVERSSQRISAEAVKAWSECTKQVKVGLIVSSDFPEDPSIPVSISVRLASIPGTPAGGGDLNIQSVYVQPAGAFTCSGPLWAARNGSIVKNGGTLSMSCARKMQQTPFDHAGRKVFAIPARITVDTAAGTATRSFSAFPAVEPKKSTSDFPIGTIIAYGGPVDTTALKTKGWLFCNGDSVSAAEHPELFSVIGTTYGGNKTMFKLPDLKGRTTIGEGTGSGLTARVLGQHVGAESSSAPSPQHTHLWISPGGGADLHTGGGTFTSAVRGADGTVKGPETPKLSGSNHGGLSTWEARWASGQADIRVGTVSPALVVNYLIKYR